MPYLKTKTTYLEMLAPPQDELPPPRPDLAIVPAAAPSVEFYRHLYSSVGSRYHWVDRLVMAEDELLAILQDPLVQIHVLEVAGRPAGYAELDGRTPGEVELAYFGLFPEAVGQGLGEYLLNWTLNKAWSGRPGRVWVHTCDLDHPAALPTYLKAGFRIYDEKIVDQWIPT